MISAKVPPSAGGSSVDNKAPDVALQVEGEAEALEWATRLQASAEDTASTLPTAALPQEKWTKLIAWEEGDSGALAGEPSQSCFVWMAAALGGPKRRG